MYTFWICFATLLLKWVLGELQGRRIHFGNYKRQWCLFVWMFCFSCGKILTWSLTIELSLNFNCVLLTLKQSQVLKSSYRNTLGCLFPYNLQFLDKRLSQYPETGWIILHGNNFSYIIFTRLISVQLRWHIKFNILAISRIFKNF